MSDDQVKHEQELVVAREVYSRARLEHDEVQRKHREAWLAYERVRDKPLIATRVATAEEYSQGRASYDKCSNARVVARVVYDAACTEAMLQYDADKAANPNAHRWFITPHN